MDLKTTYVTFEPQPQPTPLRNDHQGEVLKIIQWCSQAKAVNYYWKDLHLRCFARALRNLLFLYLLDPN